MSSTKILVCCHKNDIMEMAEPYLPIQVGKELSTVKMDIQGDDEGDNISKKNQSFCELTGLYWAWKNLKGVEVIGICHYRRYFDFHAQVPFWAPYKVISTEDFDKYDKSVPLKIIEEIHNGAVVASRKTICDQSLAGDYCMCHLSDDLRTLQTVFKDTQTNSFQSAFFKVMFQNNKKSTYNMFIMSWNDFNDYCSWLFDILFEVENRIDISHYNSVQKRIYGYMGERLLNVWLEATGKRVIEKPILWFSDSDDGMKHTSMVRYLLRTTMNNLAMQLSKPKHRVY